MLKGEIVRGEWGLEGGGNDRWLCVFIGVKSIGGIEGLGRLRGLGRLKGIKDA